ncbi:MAG TPA: hypothetical protein VJN43_11980 [Bryobacteraceae bacterium]|nr:hypothetical protein [Bryobacteraceae bacterium]
MRLIRIAFTLTVATAIACFVLEWQMLRTLPPELLYQESLHIFEVLLAPVAFSALPFALAGRGCKAQALGAFAATMLMLAFDALGAASVGLFFIPATAAMGISALRLSDPKLRAQPQQP